jgi:hypothetical protein
MTDMAPAWCGALKVATARFVVVATEQDRTGRLRGRSDVERAHWRPNCRERNSISLDDAESDITKVQLTRLATGAIIEQKTQRLEK